VSADMKIPLRRLTRLSALLALGACSWFTDFKQQPKIDPWDTPNDSTPPRGNPQGSVSLYGASAPEFIYPRTFAGLAQMTSLANPVVADARSIERGRIQYQINCATCHGPLGMGMGPVSKSMTYFPPSIGPNSPSAVTYTDGYIFGIIRNGRGLMPPYNRIEEAERWDIVNYVRSLQGKSGIAADSSHGLPGETGAKVPGASVSGPTRPAPYYNAIGAQAGAREGLMPVKPPAAGARPDSLRIPVAPPAHRPPTDGPEGASS
jgi:mono/diheme cytochrome c family protein